jgi:ComF family protein
MKTAVKPSTLDDGLKRYNWIKLAHEAWARVAARRRCILCGGRAHEIALCDGCRADLPWRERPWRLRLAAIDEVEVCFDFEYPIRQLLHRAKYGRDIAVARLLGQLFVERLATAGGQLIRPAALFPVPMARRRLLTRGYNQAIEIAEPISAEFAVAIDEVSVYKRGGLQPQSKLDAAKRRTNVRDAFVCRRSPGVSTAIIIDDVITTGATVKAMARALRTAGVQNIRVWVLAAA